MGQWSKLVVNSLNCEAPHCIRFPCKMTMIDLITCSEGNHFPEVLCDQE